MGFMIKALKWLIDAIKAFGEIGSSKAAKKVVCKITIIDDGSTQTVDVRVGSYRMQNVSGFIGKPDIDLIMASGPRQRVINNSYEWVQRLTLTKEQADTLIAADVAAGGV